MFETPSYHIECKIPETRHAKHHLLKETTDSELNGILNDYEQYLCETQAKIIKAFVEQKNKQTVNK